MSVSPTYALESPKPILSAAAASPKQVLFVKLSSLGDIVHSLPLIEALRSGLGPEVTIDWAIRSHFASLLRGNPNLSAAYELRSKRINDLVRLGGTLRLNGYDAALDAQGLFLSGLLTRLSGAPARIGLDRNRECNACFLTDPVVPGRARMHIVDKLMGFCDALGIPRVPPRQQRYLAEGESARAEDLLKAAASGARPLIGFIVGASTADKAWPAERWSETAALLNRQGAGVVLLGSLAEAETALAIEASVSESAEMTSVVGRTPLPVLASVLARCDAVVGGDSGPTHLAVAVGTPVVGLYGVTDPARTGPQWGPARSIVLDYAEKDSPAETRRPRHNRLPDALSRIPADAVAAAALSLIGAAIDRR